MRRSRFSEEQIIGLLKEADRNASGSTLAYVANAAPFAFRQMEPWQLPASRSGPSIS